MFKNISKIKKDLTKKNSANIFNYLKRRGLIEIERIGYDVRITLTEEGKKRAGKYQIDDLEIEKPKNGIKRRRNTPSKRFSRSQQKTNSSFRSN